MVLTSTLIWYTADPKTVGNMTRPDPPHGGMVRLHGRRERIASRRSAGICETICAIPPSSTAIGGCRSRTNAPADRRHDHHDVHDHRRHRRRPEVA
jgi:hypothetical protein